ncbi:MAG: DNA gyrase C-terminal beta-propeller domain-containing protein, partial [Candidatus Poseidoniaceae archaeon]
TPQLIVTCFSKDRLLIFTDKGRVYGLKAWETPLASRHARGSHIRNVIEKIQDDENIVTILPISRDLLESPDGHFLLFATRLGLIKKTKLEEYVRINRNGKYALRFKLDNDSLVNVRTGTNESAVVMISSTGFASRFACSDIRSSGRVSAGVYGIKTGNRKNADGGHVVAMMSTENTDTQILTITRNGMAKRSRLGTSEKIPDMNAEGVQKIDPETGEGKMRNDGYRKTKPGAKGAYTMNLDHESGDYIISARQIPNLDDNVFLLTKKGMMIRINAGQTKETKNKKSKGTRVMELRNAKKTGFVDHIIFAARLPAELVENDSLDDDSEGNSEEE